MSAARDPFRARQVALYQTLTSDLQILSEYYGADDKSYHSTWVRISEPVEVSLQKLSSEEAIQNAVAALDAEERRIRLELQDKLDALKAQRAILLALTHQAADDDPTPWCTGCGAKRQQDCHCGPIADNQ